MGQFLLKYTYLCILMYIMPTALGKKPKAILLNDGHRMPPIAFGTFGKISEVKTVTASVIWAIESGYRHIDTAPLYFNEAQVGEAIANVTRRGIVSRKDLFITTKLDRLSNRSAVVPALKESLKRLKLDYVDLYLIHTPLNLMLTEELNYVDIWKGMKDAKELGLAKSIGISNFNSSQINTILATGGIRPAVNQIEVNPTYTNLELVAYCQSQDIHVISFSPFGFLVPRPYRNVSMTPTLDNPTLMKIAEKYNKTPNQVVLRYLIDRGTVPIPKSSNREHIASNINVFDFHLTQHEVYRINQLDLNIPVYDFNNMDDIYTYFFESSLEEVIRMLNEM